MLLTYRLTSFYKKITIKHLLRPQLRLQKYFNDKPNVKIILL